MTDKTKKPQKDLILSYMEQFGSITPLEAQTVIGCMRLGARIWDLRRDGHNIVKEMVEVQTRNGGKATVARYRLGGYDG